MIRNRFVPALATVAGLLLASSSSFAAGSGDGCTGIISSLPATISTQGTWCLNRNLTTRMTEGAAITIAANNVTLDCRDFKIGGLQAGRNALATGITLEGRSNATVRHCTLRGFYLGLYFRDADGSLVEDNRIDQSRGRGMVVIGDDSVVRRNAVYDTGGRYVSAVGIWARGDILDNVVSGVATNGAPSGTVTGIVADGRGGEVVRGNVIGGLVATGTSAQSTGLEVFADAMVLDNRVTLGPGVRAGYGIFAPAGTCRGNTVIGVLGGIYGCISQSDNFVVTTP